VAAVTLSDFLATWRGLTLENRLHRLAVLGLIGLGLTGFGLFVLRKRARRP